MSAARAPFGTLPDGRAVERVTLEGSSGFAVALLTYGATIQSILAPDAAGALGEVVLGHDTLEGYLSPRAFFGATIGRYANRIADGTFALGDRTVRIEPNNGPNALHGGAGGFDTKLFAVRESGANRLVLGLRSPDGEEGFPGTLDVTATFEVDGTSLSILYEAITDATTVVNLTNHAFFNLGGAGSVLGHELAVEADRFLPVAPGGIPTGEEAPVAGTPFDFREPAAIGARIRDPHPQIRTACGYDHNFCLTGGRTDAARPVAQLRDPASGRAMVLSTSEPGLQVYSGNFLDGSITARTGQVRQGDAVCLEPQAFPDSPNRPAFPSTSLSAGETYRHSIRLDFAPGSPS